MTQKNNHARRTVIIILAVVLAGCVTAVQRLHLLTGNPSTTLPATEAERRYRASTTTSIAMATSSTAATAVKLPVPGVYTYATTGRDSVDALNGAHHDYPATTTITVTPTACGVRQRWDVLKQRWEEWQRCGTIAGITEVGRTSHDEFFGQAQTDTWKCSGAPRPVDAASGTAWVTSCVNGSSTDTYKGVVIGTERRTVGSKSVGTTHVRITIVNRTPSDRQVIDTWYLTGSDLVVAQTASAATSNDTQLGIVHYNEAYSITLVSLTPSS
jgi:hypothetical protein